MQPHTRKPAATRADRLPIGFAVAAESNRESSRDLLNFQALIMTRRFGVSPAIALALAPFVFGEARNG
jgi:hypothetical protein